MSRSKAYTTVTSIDCKPRRLTLRRVPVVFLMLAAVGCGASQKPEKEAGRKAASVKQIAVEDVEISDVHLLKGRNGSGFHVDGQVQNHAPKVTLKDFQFHMVMQDCLPTGVCKNIAQDTVTVAVNLLPGHSGAFQAEPDFGKMPAPEGQLGWHYAVVSASAAQE